MTSVLRSLTVAILLLLDRSPFLRQSGPPYSPQAALETLDELQKAAEQIKIFSKRG